MRRSSLAALSCAAFCTAFFCQVAVAEFQIERVRGIYTLRAPGKRGKILAQRSSGQRKIAWGSRVQLEQGDFSEAQAQLVGHGLEIALLGGSGVALAGQAPQITRLSGALRVRALKSESLAAMQVRLGEKGRWSELTLAWAGSGLSDWIVFERFAEPQAGQGARDPELVVVVLRGELRLTRPERGSTSGGAAGKSRETLILKAGDQYTHSNYSGGDYSAKTLAAGEAEAFYRQWGWEPK